jgi:hypothetical protein
MIVPIDVLRDDDSAFTSSASSTDWVSSHRVSNWLGLSDVSQIPYLDQSAVMTTNTPSETPYVDAHGNMIS